MQSKRARSYNGKRYQNDLRAIRKATGAGYREAQGLYRQVRDLAGRRPARADIVKRSKVKLQLRRDFDDRKPPPAPYEPGKKPAAGTVKGAFPMSEMKRFIEKILGLGMEISIDAPFASYEIEKTEAGPDAEAEGAAAYIALYGPAKAHLKALGEIQGNEAKLPDGAYWFDAASWSFEYSESLGQCHILWEGS